MKTLKVLLSLLAITLLLLIAAVILLPQFIDPNDYKEEITAKVKQHTGLELAINGKLSLSVFPWLGVNTGNVVLSQPSIIRDSVSNAGAFANIEAIDIKVKLKPLFSRKIEVDTILLKKPRIEFITNASGNNSLTGLSPSSAEKPSTKASTTAASNSGKQATVIAAFTIAGVNISDGEIIIDDRQAKTRYEVTRLNITSGNVLSGAKAPLSLSGIFSAQNITPISVNLDTQLSFDQNSLAATINDFSASMQQAETTLNTQIESITYSHQTAASRIINLALSGNFANATNNIPFSLSVPDTSIDLKKTIVKIPTISASSLGIDFSGNLSIKNWNDMLMASGKIQFSRFDAKPVIQKLALDYLPSKKTALEKIAFASNFNGTTKGLSLRNILINIDDTIVEGNIALIDFSKPRYRFDLSLNAIVIDDYLPITKKTASTSAAQDTTTATQALAAPIVLLQHIDANGVFRAKKITANNIHLENNIITVASTKNQVTITPEVELYKGKLDGKITLDKNKNTLKIVSQLTNVELEPLLSDAKITEQFSGIGNLSTNIVVTETNTSPNSPSIAGTIKLAAKNGAIKGIDIKKVLDDAQATIDKIRGKNVSEPTKASTDETRFAEMTATLLLNDDIISNNDLSIKAPAFRISGDGTVNTSTQTLDYLTSIIVVNTNSGQGGKNTDQLKGATIPVRFTGPLAAPKYKIDTRALIKTNTKQAVDEEKEKLKNKLLKKLGIKKEASANTTTTQTKPKESKEDLKEQLKRKLFDKLF
ncbi:MAG: AsmA protein [Kiritimatiellia bacterium]|jgi:AsmA protein